jgi:2-oxoglutarate dehydrogenase E2 component (dihydrolipoamide succinyltransferase)
MKIDIKVPVMGESVTEAIVASFLVPSGSEVSSGQEILELETDKVNQVLYAPASGQLNLAVAVGETVKIDQVIGFVETDSVKKEEKPSILALQKESPAAATTPKKSFPEKIEQRKKMSLLRKTIANRLVEVKNKTAMLTTFNEVDMSAVLFARDRVKDHFFTKHSVKLGFMSFFVKGAIFALDAYPVIRSYLEGEEIITPSSMDVGIAVSTDKGLFVPVVRSAETLSYGQLESKIAELAEKARNGSIAMDDLQGGSFTITNGGVFGSLLSTPILNPPQSAILGMHSITKRAVVVDEQIVIRPMMYLALSYDHRLIDGKEAVLFLVCMKKYLENPENFSDIALL